jgi:sulfide:quinone oxidoreductase
MTPGGRSVVVLGGGFGGLAAAHELRRVLPPDDEITVVAASDRFFVGFAKLWDLVGARPLDEGAAPLRNLERHGIRFLQAEVTGLDPAARTVTTTEGELTADGLVVALGAGYPPAHTALLGPRVHNLYDAEALPAMRADLAALDRGRLVIAILGGPYLCPPAPYEAALLLDERLGAQGRRPTPGGDDDGGGVELVVTTPMPLTLPVAGPDASRYLADRLAERAVTVHTDHRVAEVDHAERTLVYAGGTALDFDVALVVPAAAPRPVLAPLAGPSGWVEPDPQTFATAFDRVYAVGDCTQVPTATAQLPKAGVFAEATALVAARNLAADLHGGQPAVYDGHGFCYLELPGHTVARVEGNFYARPAPAVTLSAPTSEAFTAKQAWEHDHLARWLG